MCDPGTLAGVESRRSRIDMSVDAFKALVVGKCGPLDWATDMPPVLVDARDKAHMYAAWLHDKATDELRHCKPIMDAAEGVAPHCTYCVNRNTNAVEYFDAKAGVWRRSGGEYFISGQALSRLLQAHIRTFAFVPTAQEASCKMVLCADVPSMTFKDPAWLEPIFKALKSIPTPWDDIPLDSRAATRSQLVCANGVTVDFAEAYAAQIRKSVPSDRSLGVACIPHSCVCVRDGGWSRGLPR